MTTTLEQAGKRLEEKAKQRKLALCDRLADRIEQGVTDFEDAEVEELLATSGQPLDYITWLYNSLVYRRSLVEEIADAESKKDLIAKNEQEIARLNREFAELKKKFEDQWNAIGRQVQEFEDENRRLRREASEQRHSAQESLRNTADDAAIENHSYLDWRNIDLERPKSGPIKGLPCLGGRPRKAGMT